jgi:selenocysteine lyase/cysteine desulfurase
VVRTFYALLLRRSARLLTCEAEFAANYFTFLQRAKRDGLTIEAISLDADRPWTSARSRAEWATMSG